MLKPSWIALPLLALACLAAAVLRPVSPPQRCPAHGAHVDSVAHGVEAPRVDPPRTGHPSVPQHPAQVVPASTPSASDLASRETDDGTREAFRLAHWGSEEAAVRAIEELLSTQREEFFESGRGDLLIDPIDPSATATLGYASLSRLADLLRAQTSAARRRFVARAIRLGVMMKPAPSDLDGAADAFLSRLSLLLRAERDAGVIQPLLCAIESLPDATGRSVAFSSAVREVALDGAASAEVRGLAVDLLVPGAVRGEAAILDALEALSRGPMADAAIDAMARTTADPATHPSVAERLRV